MTAAPDLRRYYTAKARAARLPCRPLMCELRGFDLRRNGRSAYRLVELP